MLFTPGIEEEYLVVNPPRTSGLVSREQDFAKCEEVPLCDQFKARLGEFQVVKLSHFDRGSEVFSIRQKLREVENFMISVRQDFK